MPRFAEAATALKEMGSSVIMAKLDAERYAKAAEGFPTILLYVNSSSRPYTGGFTGDEILIWVRKKIGLPLVRLTSVTAAKEFLKKHQKHVICFFESYKGIEYDEFVKAAATENEIQFVETNDIKVAKVLFPDIGSNKSFIGLVKSEPERYESFGRPTDMFTWNDFSTTLASWFVPPSERRSLQEKYLWLIQRDRTVIAYERELTHLSRYASTMQGDENEKCSRFVDGLRDSLRQPLMTMVNANYRSLVDTARKLEAGQQKVQKRNNFRSKRTQDAPQQQQQSKSSQGKNWNKKQKIDDRRGGQPGAKVKDYPFCLKCYCHHLGECLATAGVGYKCQQPGHIDRHCQGTLVVQVTAFNNRIGSKYLMESDIITGNLENFCTRLLHGTLSPFFKSEPIPNHNEMIRKVVGRTFDSSILESAENVFLEVYTPWCIDCETTSKQVEKLAKHFKGQENVMFARFDASLNEHPKLQVDVYPALLFYPAGNKSNPIKISKKLSTKELAAFIKENTRSRSGSKSNSNPKDEL